MKFMIARFAATPTSWIMMYLMAKLQLPILVMETNEFLFNLS